MAVFNHPMEFDADHMAMGGVCSSVAWFCKHAYSLHDVFGSGWRLLRPGDPRHRGDDLLLGEMVHVDFVLFVSYHNITDYVYDQRIHSELIKQIFEFFYDLGGGGGALGAPGNS